VIARGLFAEVAALPVAGGAQSATQCVQAVMKGGELVR
jgi:hypothetical protein